MGFIRPDDIQDNGHDVIVVGAGARQMACPLTMQGARALMLQAGRHVDAAAHC